jgi:hypothetical protein
VALTSSSDRVRHRGRRRSLSKPVKLSLAASEAYPNGVVYLSFLPAS